MKGRGSTLGNGLQVEDSAPGVSSGSSAWAGCRCTANCDLQRCCRVGRMVTCAPKSTPRPSTWSPALAEHRRWEGSAAGFLQQPPVQKALTKMWGMRTEGSNICSAIIEQNHLLLPHQSLLLYSYDVVKVGWDFRVNGSSCSQFLGTLMTNFPSQASWLNICLLSELCFYIQTHCQGFQFQQ